MANPPIKYKLAVGLSYDEMRDPAPTLSVKGENLNADQIVKIAKRYGVPVVERAEVARSLIDRKLDQEIPASLYEAVALIFSQIKQRLF